MHWILVKHLLGEHGVVIRAFDMYWGGIRFGSISTHHCGVAIIKTNAFGVEKQNKKQR